MAKYDYGNAATGALSGAAAGTAVLPGIGTGVGALIGGLGGLFGSKKKKKKKLSNFDPMQQQLYDSQMAGLRGEGDLASLYNFDADAANQNFDQNVARPAYRNFNEKVIPNITGQFRGNGIGNSTYTGEALGRAGRDVQESLDSARSQAIYSGQQDAMGHKRDAIANLLGQSTFSYEAPRQSSLDSILSQTGPLAAKYFASQWGQ